LGKKKASETNGEKIETYASAGEGEGRRSMYIETCMYVRVHTRCSVRETETASFSRASNVLEQTDPDFEESQLLN
jgi:hypothetical protein